jgi:hypothetical protein
MNLADAATEMARLSRLIDAGLQAMRDQGRELAEAENVYRKAKAEAWARCPNDPTGTKPADRDWTSAHREAWVDGETADERSRRDLAEVMGKAAYQAVRARQTQVSALQSLLNAERAEAEFVRTTGGMAA